MIVLKTWITLALFLCVLSEAQNKIKDFKTYKEYKGFIVRLNEMNATGTITDNYAEKLVLLRELVDNYEKEYPQVLEGESGDIPPSIRTTTRMITVKTMDPTLCSLHLEMTEHYNAEADLEKLMKRKYIHLLKYTIEFYKVNDSELLHKMNFSENYDVFTWYHTYTDQGKNILALTSDYDIKSLSLLTSGVEEFPIKVFENKENCFSKLSSDNQKSKIISFLLKNFFNQSGKEQLYEHNLCYPKVDIKNSRGKFVHECCNVKNECQIIKNVYMDVFSIFLLVIKIVFLLLCPMIIQKLFYSKKIGKFNYTVPVSKPGLKKTMLIKRVNSDYETVRSSKFLPGNKSMQQFSNFRKLVKSIPSDEIVSVNFLLLDVSIDHSELLSKTESPIQYFQYIYSTLIRCQCGRSHPFRTCLGESIVGTWSPNFLWCRLGKKCEANNSCRECLSWFAIFRLFSTILLIIFLPLPFYTKVFYYHFYEKEMLNDKKKTLDNLGYEEDIYQILIQGIYKYICYLGLFLCYFLSALVFVLLRALFPSQISNIINQCVKDFKNINRFECFRMIISHVVLPFEKFGILGIVVGVFYWPIVIPISIILTIIYCIPLIYIIGRMFILERPQCIDGNPANQLNMRSHGSHSISRNVSSIANCFFLDHISPKSRVVECNISHEKPLKKTRLFFCCSVDKTRLLSFIKNIIIGIIFITLLLSLCVMYTEAFGFFIEIIFLSFLGSFLNGQDVVLYLIFALIVVFYIILFLHHIKWKYSSFSNTLFEAIQSKLCDEMMKKMVLCGEAKENTAFKYFSHEETNNKNLSKFPELNHVQMRGDGLVERIVDNCDNIEYLSGKLHWTVNSLVIFMDGYDVIRMPKDLFWRICNLDIPSSPGPLWKTLFLSTVKLIGVFIYLALLLLIILFYSDTQTIYSKWQDEKERFKKSSMALKIFFIVLFGLLPGVIYIIVQFCRCKTQAPMIGERISWIIKSYRRSWPVSDLVFENPESPKPLDSRSRNATAEIGDLPHIEDTDGGVVIGNNVVRNEIPLKVDLLITLKDEPVFNPNRLSMASNGSLQSLTSINKLSPEGIRPHLKDIPMEILASNNLQRPLLSVGNEGGLKENTVDIELQESRKKLEYHVT